MNSLKKEFDSLSGNWIVIVETSAENALKVNQATVKLLNKKGLSGIIISATRPCNNVKENYKKVGIDTNKIFMVCAVCKAQGVAYKDTNKIIHVQNASALTEISIALSKLKNKGGFLLLDSVSSLLIYNNPKNLARFIHSVITKLRLNKTNGVLLFTKEDTNKEIRAEIMQLSDKVIKV